MAIMKKAAKSALDINGNVLIVGDTVKITQARIDKYGDGRNWKVGEELVITELYTMPDFYGDEVLGRLRYLVDDGTIFNSDMATYEKA
jgi:hypothetical protein